MVFARILIKLTCFTYFNIHIFLQDEETEALLSADFEIGHFFRERIIPKVMQQTSSQIQNPLRSNLGQVDFHANYCLIPFLLKFLISVHQIGDNTSSETQGQIVGTRKSLNGRKNIWHEEK